MSAYFNYEPILALWTAAVDELRQRGAVVYEPGTVDLVLADRPVIPLEVFEFGPYLVTFHDIFPTEMTMHADPGVRDERGSRRLKIGSATPASEVRAFIASLVPG